MNEIFGPSDISFESALNLLIVEHGEKNVSASLECYNGPRSIKIQIEGKWETAWSE